MVKFYKLNYKERINLLRKKYKLNEEDIKELSIDQADKMIENVIGVYGLPLGIATNFKINGKKYLIPMAIEESSVVAAASNGAKHALPDGFKAKWNGNITVGQIQIKTRNPLSVKKKIILMKKIILEKMDEISNMKKYGGGAKNVEVSIKKTKRGNFVVVYLFFDTANAMGANTINTICEKIAPFLIDKVGGNYILRIISNYAIEKIATAEATFRRDVVGEDVIEGILDAYALACSDVRRAVTHNKGIMNGIDAIAIATGQDWRAIEAGAHAYAARSGRYLPLTHWEKNKNGDLVGKIEIPIQVGTVGGITTIHPTAKLALKILKIKDAKDLACIMAAVGLAQNFAALRALASEGIQRGHMKLHSINLAMAVGAKGKLAEKIAKRMIDENNISMKRAEELKEELKGERKEKMEREGKGRKE